MSSSEDIALRNAVQSALAARYGHTVPVPEGLSGLPELLRIARQTSHRSWTGAEVSAEMVQFLAACGMAAPSKSHLQQADIVDVRDADKRAAIHALVPGMPWMADAPALLVFCANGRRFQRLFERFKLPFNNDHLDAFFNPVVDASLVMMNFIHAAGVAGMVSCPISMIRNAPERLAEILELPKRVIPVAGLCLGFPLKEREPVARLTLTATFHRNSFDPGLDDDAIDDFDRRYAEARVKLSPTPAPAPSLWSEERIAQYAEPQRANWGSFVRSAGFDLQ